MKTKTLDRILMLLIVLIVGATQFAITDYRTKLIITGCTALITTVILWRETDVMLFVLVVALWVLVFMATLTSDQLREKETPPAPPDTLSYITPALDQSIAGLFLNKNTDISER